MRDKSGRFVKGYSGNAAGRPKDRHNIAELLVISFLEYSTNSSFPFRH